MTLALSKPVPVQSYSCAAVMLCVHAAPYSAGASLVQNLGGAGQCPWLLSEYCCCMEVHKNREGHMT